MEYIVEYKGIQSPNYKAVVKNDKFLKLKCYQSCFSVINPMLISMKEI